MTALGHGVWHKGLERGGVLFHLGPGIVLSGWSQKVEHSGALVGRNSCIMAISIRFNEII